LVFIYGVAYAVGQRSNEIGLRMALGASAGSVLRLILGQGLGLAGFGLVLGLAASVASTQLLTVVLFQVRPTDPPVNLPSRHCGRNRPPLFAPHVRMRRAAGQGHGSWNTHTAGDRSTF
jgi:ABC-type antimicrobial peptide transport system permease subunit